MVEMQQTISSDYPKGVRYQISPQQPPINDLHDDMQGDEGFMQKVCDDAKSLRVLP